MYSFSYWKNHFNTNGIPFDKEPFIPFMTLWMSYNNFYNNFTGCERTRACKIGEDEKAKKIFEDNKDKFLFEFSNIPQSNSTPRLCVINPKERKRNAYFDEQHPEIKDFLSAVYQIRCNLFHGDKSPHIDVDKGLVKWAYECLYKILHEYKPDLF